MKPSKPSASATDSAAEGGQDARGAGEGEGEVSSAEEDEEWREAVEQLVAAEELLGWEAIEPSWGETNQIAIKLQSNCNHMGIK